VFEAPHSQILKYMDEWQYVSPITTGKDLRSRQLKPGPVYRLILDELRAAWLDGKVSSRDEELDLLERMLEGISDADDVST